VLGVWRKCAHIQSRGGTKVTRAFFYGSLAWEEICATPWVLVKETREKTLRWEHRVSQVKFGRADGFITVYKYLFRNLKN
jgi:hypothetical protein